jgi:hypothetical protein
MWAEEEEELPATSFGFARFTAQGLLRKPRLHEKCESHLFRTVSDRRRGYSFTDRLSTGHGKSKSRARKRQARQRTVLEEYPLEIKAFALEALNRWDGIENRWSPFF